LVHQGYTPTAEGLQNGTIVGANMTGGPPVSAVTQAFAAMGDKLTVLDFTDEQMAAANGDGSLWTRFVIPCILVLLNTTKSRALKYPNR